MFREHCEYIRITNICGIFFSANCGTCIEEVRGCE